MSEKELLLPSGDINKRRYDIQHVEQSIETLPENYVPEGASDNSRNKRRKYRCDNFLPCDPRRWMHRFMMLGLMCFLSFGSYYCYDNPASLIRTFIEVMDIDNTQYNLLYSLYSWPNVILSLIGGVLLDRYLGVRLGTVVFSAFVTFGQLIFALGGIFDSFILMLVGRFVFGIGGESLAVAQNAYAVMWFKGKELNMVFGLLLSISRVGSTVNMNVNSKMFDSFSFITDQPKRLGLVLFVGFGWCILSLLAAVALGLFDKRAAKITKRKEGEGERISLRDIKDFSLALWLVFFVCVFYYVTVFPFIGLATVFLEDKYGFPAHIANIVNSLVYLISAGVSPVFGIAVDKTGFNLIWLNFGIIATLGCHAAFAFGSGSAFIPYLAMIGMGLAYSILACALWPLVAFLVPEHQLGTAYGIMQSVQNLGLAIVPLIAGAIVDGKGYLLLETFFCTCLCVALICGVLLYVIDFTSEGTLNLSSWARHRLEKEKEEKEKIALDKNGISPGGVSDGSGEIPIALQPHSAFQLRNRLLSRMGAQIPDHVVRINPLTTSFAHLGLTK